MQEWALWNGLADCYEQGLIAEVGVSNYGARELRRVAKDFEKRGVQLASAQVSPATASHLWLPIGDTSCLAACILGSAVPLVPSQFEM